ncbi:DUF1189 domain-containing protein [Halalkalibacter kiskunsagensis]|uniref:DUF1189 domain-containing protein n=1 Tax=Halalkalibacter kiskunsagensis TaxID=1548599 RepID=A0ABV6KKT0_9BACI
MKEVFILSYWDWFLKSFYSKKVIAYSRFRPITSTIGYVLFIIFISSIPYFVTLYSTATSAVEQFDNMLQNDIPNFHLREGTLYWESEEPFYTEVAGEGFFLIDSSNTYSEQELQQLVDGIALQQREFLFIADGNSQSIPYTLLGLQEFTKEDLSKRINDLQGFLPILLFIIIFLLFVALSGLAFLGISLLAFVALLLKGARNLEYRHLWLITAHALTLPVILLAWVDVLFYPIPFSAFIASTFLLVLISVKSIPVPQKKS